LVVETSCVEYFTLAQSAPYRLGPAFDAGQARGANRNAANFDQRAFAQSAVVGKESRENPVS
jgi:hypothetical protein